MIFCSVRILGQSKIVRTKPVPQKMLNAMSSTTMDLLSLLKTRLILESSLERSMEQFWRVLYNPECIKESRFMTTKQFVLRLKVMEVALASSCRYEVEYAKPFLNRNHQHFNIQMYFQAFQIHQLDFQHTS